MRGRVLRKNNICDDELEQKSAEGKRRFKEEEESETTYLGNGKDKKKANKGARRRAWDQKQSFSNAFIAFYASPKVFAKNTTSSAYSRIG